jgi:hypothetical protein
MRIEASLASYSTRRNPVEPRSTWPCRAWLRRNLAAKRVLLPLTRDSVPHFLYADSARLYTF